MNGMDVEARQNNGETFRRRTAKSLEIVEAQSIGGRIRTGEKIHRRIKRSERKLGRAVPTSTGPVRGMDPNNGQMGQRCGHIRFGSESRNAGSTRIRNPDIGPETRSLKFGMRYRRSEVGRRRCDLDQPFNLGPIARIADPWTVPPIRNPSASIWPGMHPASHHSSTRTISSSHRSDVLDRNTKPTPW